MKENSVKNKSLAELQTIIKESKAKLLKLRFELAENRLKNFNEIKSAKKAIARAMTEIKAIK